MNDLANIFHGRLLDMVQVMVLLRVAYQFILLPLLSLIRTFKG